MELAAAKLVISVLSPVITKVGSYVADSYLGGDLTAEEMEDLAVYVLPTIKTVVEEAELVPLQHLEPWLEKLQVAVFEAEDLLDLHEYKKIKIEVSSLPELVKKCKNKTKETFGFMLRKSSFRISYEKLKKSAAHAEKLLQLINSVSKTTTKQLKYKFPQGSTSTTVSTISSPLFGRDEECNTIIEMLLTDESHANSNKRIESVPIIAIKGLPGTGKTSIAQKIYNHERVKIFDLRMWVHVSRSFDVRRLTKEIIEIASKEKCPRVDNLDLLQTKLKESISKAKKFLLVLDDIWCEDKVQFDKLLSPLNEVKGNGSKIVITTRTEKVAHTLQVDRVVSLEDLKRKDCWSILKHYAFGNSEIIIEDKELANIGKQIISKVKYSPLALRVVGSSMGRRVSVNEWENILKQDILKETMDVYFLSFQHLPSHLQRCFAYCSLFPKGYEFNSDELVPLWIAQGFVEITDESELTLEEKGRIFMEELLFYSFFEIKKSIDDYSKSYYKMHDLLHDLAENVSKKYYHRFENSSYIPETCIHLSVSSMDNSRNADIPDMSKLKNLRTLIFLYNPLCSVTCTFQKPIFPSLSKLRALYVPFRNKEVILSNLRIDKLKHLRYLNLQHEWGLYKSLLAKLYHLQFLYLHKNFELVDFIRYWNVGTDDGLGKGLENLVNLRTLKLGSENSELYSPQMNIRKLTSLQNLSAFHPKKDGVNGMMLLKNLNLHESLSIKSLENIKSKAEAEEAMLNKKKNLNDLTFEWSRMYESNSCEDVLNGLEPHPNLEGLSIIRYQGVNAPNWMKNENRLPCLLKLRLYMCKRVKEIPCLPPCLKELHVENCNDLVRIPPIGDTLRTLKLEDCSKLMLPQMYNKSIHLKHIVIKRCARNEESQLFNDLSSLTNLQELILEGFFNVQTFPNLSNTLNIMEIEDFPKLTSLGNMQHCTSLKQLIIGNCPMLIGPGNLQYCTSLKRLIIKECSMLTSLGNLQYCTSLKHLRIEKLPMLMTDEGDITLRLPSSIERVDVVGSDRPFPPFLEENLHHISSLQYLWLEDFTTLPSLEKLSSLNNLFIADCPGVGLLPNLPISLLAIHVYGCPNLKVKYKKGGPLRDNISHVPAIEFSKYLQLMLLKSNVLWLS